jgi:hypothetical protein
VLTGKIPYAGRSEIAVLAAVLCRELHELPREFIPDDGDPGAATLWLLLLRCWQHNPDSRPKAVEVKTEVSHDLVCATWLSPRIRELEFLHREQRPLPSGVLSLIGGAKVPKADTFDRAIARISYGH